MKMSKNGLEKLKKYEDFKGEAYQDNAGKWTIGYGHTGNVKKGMKITKEAATKLLHNDLKRFEARVNEHVNVPLTPHQYDALVSFDYNTGGLAGSNLLKKLNTGDYHAAFNEELPKWNKITTPDGRKVISKGLVNRRKFEQEMANTPFYSPEGMDIKENLNDNNEEENNENSNPFVMDIRLPALGEK